MCIPSHMVTLTNLKSLLKALTSCGTQPGPIFLNFNNVFHMTIHFILGDSCSVSEGACVSLTVLCGHRFLKKDREELGTFITWTAGVPDLQVTPIIRRRNTELSGQMGFFNN